MVVDLLNDKIHYLFFSSVSFYVTFSIYFKQRAVLFLRTNFIPSLSQTVVDQLQLFFFQKSRRKSC